MSRLQRHESFTPRQLAAIRRIIDNRVATERAAFRAVSGDSIRNLRLAKTVSRDGSYPSTGNTFAIRFVDCGFSAVSPGTSSLSCSERTAEGDTSDADDVIAREINGQYVAEGTYVAALWQRGVQGSPSNYGEWWIRLKEAPPPWDPPPCTVCTSDADTVTVTISGATDSLCNRCNENLNGTFVLSRVFSNACLWTYTNYNHNCYLHGSGFITYGSLFIQAASQQLYPSSNKGWRVSIGYGVTWWPGGFPPTTYSQNAIYQWNSGSSSAFDCTATRNLSLHSYVPDPVTDPCANLDSLTVTVN